MIICTWIISSFFINNFSTSEAENFNEPGIKKINMSPNYAINCTNTQPVLGGEGRTVCVCV